MKDEKGNYRRMTQAERDDQRTRNLRFNMRYTAREKAEIEARMREAGYEKMNDYLLDVAKNGYVLVPQGKYIESIRDCSYELNKIGVNVNQIAHRVNSTDVCNDYDFASLKMLINEAFMIIKEAYDYFLE